MLDVRQFSLQNTINYHLDHFTIFFQNSLNKSSKLIIKKYVVNVTQCESLYIELVYTELDKINLCLKKLLRCHIQIIRIKCWYVIQKILINLHALY